MLQKHPYTRIRVVHTFVEQTDTYVCCSYVTHIHTWRLNKDWPLVCSCITYCSRFILLYFKSSILNFKHLAPLLCPFLMKAQAKTARYFLTNYSQFLLCLLLLLCLHTETATIYQQAVGCSSTHTNTGYCLPDIVRLWRFKPRLFHECYLDTHIWTRSRFCF